MEGTIRVLSEWMLALLSLACKAHDVTGDYEARKARALGPPAALTEGWESEVALQLGEELVVSMLKGAANAELAEAPPLDLPVGKVRFDAELKKVQLIEPDCDQCVGLRGTIKGTARLRVKKLKKEFPFTLRFRAQMHFQTSEGGLRGRHLFMSLQDIQELELELAGYEAELAKPLKGASRELLEGVKDVDLGAVASPDLLLRDVRVRGSSDGLLIEALAMCVEPAGMTLPSFDGEGFQVVMSEGVLLDASRKDAFQAGDISGEHAMNLHAEPTSLDVEGERFTLGLRLWRLEGSGWWRDYTLEGPIELSKGHIRLKADDLQEGERSPGAALVDPLSWLGEGLILEGIAESAHGAWPARDAFPVGDLRLTTTFTSARGEGEALILEGEAVTHAGTKKAKAR